MNSYRGGDDYSMVFSCIWTIGWLFTIGYLDLSFWRGVLALFVWPYFIGKRLRKDARVSKDTPTTIA